MPLKWGILSAGLICADFCTALKTLDPEKHEIAAVAARSIEDAQRFAERFQIPRHYGSYDALCESKDVDVVYVGTVNSKHKDACLLSIRNGKHVLCQKPMTLNSTEQEEVLTAAREKGVFFMEALWSRFFPAMAFLRQELRSGSIGEPKIVQANFFLNIKDVERVRSAELGGGALLDIGIYAVQFVLDMFNHEEPTAITASGHLMETGVDECMNITLKFSNNRLAVITTAVSCGILASGTIVGERGIIQIPQYLSSPTDLILSNGNLLQFDIPNAGEGNRNKRIGLVYHAEAVREAIESGLTEHPLMTHNQSRLIMKIMDEAKRQIN